jgi:hypothetical protein
MHLFFWEQIKVYTIDENIYYARIINGLQSFAVDDLIHFIKFDFPF